jgi:hypothetical protein
MNRWNLLSSLAVIAGGELLIIAAIVGRFKGWW